MSTTPSAAPPSEEAPVAAVGGEPGGASRPPAPGPAEVEPFTVDGWTGEVAAELPPLTLAAEVRRLVDPASAVESLHWGRNYLYRARLSTVAGPVEVVVKQFRGDSWSERLRRRLKGTKAGRSWRAARAMRRAGLPTPEPLMVVESRRSGGPSFYVCRYLPGVVEARYLLRAARRGRAAEEFPEVGLGTFLSALGRLLRRLHDSGFQHRDVSVGNVLLRPAAAGGEPEIWLVDLNRTRAGRRLGVVRRSRELSRLALFRPSDQEALLGAYWGGPPGRLRRALFVLSQLAFQAKQRSKAPLAGLRRRLARLRPRRGHVHLPAPPAGASARDMVVWDRLSDQPHQHAGRLAKVAVRLADLPAHLEGAAVLAGAAPRVWRRYRALAGDLYRRPHALAGFGLCLRPHVEDPDALLAAVEELGVRRLLLRLHPWQDDHSGELELARELAARGYELAFALPQNRDLVKDPERWRRSVEALGEAFGPCGRHFQVGQAINRSKWGVWRLGEYVELATAAGEILRRRPGVELLGPAVIDFEHHATATVLNLRRPGLYFDVVSSLLYVDRRGAPENRQLGFDTVGKAVLLRAIAETSRNSAGRCWITEVNWPLWEGPHSPAGKGVAVDEETQADYLVRYYLLALTTGLVERVYWWQLVARGYGLVRPGEGGALDRRPAFRALAHLARRLEGAVSTGPLPAPPGARLFAFRPAGGGELAVGWCAGTGPLRARLPRRPAAAFGRDGGELPAPDGEEVELLPSPRYFLLED